MCDIIVSQYEARGRALTGLILCLFYLNLEADGGHDSCPVPLVFHSHTVSMYGPNYSGGGYHHQSSSRPYQSPNQQLGGAQLGGGYSSGYNGDPQLLQWFNAVDTDRSGSISVAELQAALVNGQRPFLISSPIVR
jgi:hypothetical protein